jgi:membrane protein DedA with SNARE-associated domain
VPATEQPIEPEASADAAAPTAAQGGAQPAAQPAARSDPSEPASEPGREPTGPAGTGTDTEGTEGKEWWDDPRMPWKGRPGRADLLCWIGFTVSGIIGLIMIPLRPVLLGASPLALVAITGSRSGLVTIGALSAVDRADWWPIGLVLGVLSSVKWDPLFWWAGRLWGRGLIEVVAGRSRWAARNADRAERLARRYAIPAVLLTYVLPLPAAVVFATVGMAGMRLRTFLVVDLLGAAVLCSLYVLLGHRLGQSAVDVVDTIARYSGYISIGLVLIIVLNAVWRSGRQKTDRAA